LFDQWPQKFSTFANVDIAWVNNRPPLDEPPCGYDFKKCRDMNYRLRDSQIAAGVLGGIFLSAVIVTLFVYRKWKVEQEIAGLVWKIDPKDLSNHHNLGGYIDKSASKVINSNPIWRSVSPLFQDFWVQLGPVKRSAANGATVSVSPKSRVIERFKSHRLTSI
jgi:hypothetical protein